MGSWSVFINDLFFFSKLCPLNKFSTFHCMENANIWYDRLGSEPIGIMAVEKDITKKSIMHTMFW